MNEVNESGKRFEKSLGFDGLGTRWEILVYEEVDLGKLKMIVDEFIEDFENELSRFRRSSISFKARSRGLFEVSERVLKLMRFYFEMEKLSGGKFNFRVGGKLEELGYGILVEGFEVRDVEGFGEVRIVERGKVWSDGGVVLDFGAAGKGFLLDLLAEEFEKIGVRKFLINAGGDILVKGEKVFVGLEDPNDEKKVLAKIEIGNGSFCGSSGNRRKWVDGEGKLRNHLLEAEEINGKEVLATWVWAEFGMVADGIATGLFFCEPEKFREKFEFEYFVLYTDYTFNSSMFK